MVLVGQAFEESSLLRAFDICFKCFYVFDVNFTKQCCQAWEFLQKAVYGLGKKALSPGVAVVKLALTHC